MGEESGKGMVAGGGVLAVLVSVFAHTADDCARAGARGAAASHALEQGARLGAEGAAVGKGLGVAAGDGARLGARGAQLEAQGARALRGVDAARLAQGGKAADARQLAARAWLSPLERQVVEEIPGYTLDVIDLASDAADLGDAARPAAGAEPASYRGKLTYLPLHDDFELRREKIHTAFEALPAARTPEQIDRAIDASLSSPLVMTGWMNAAGKLGEGDGVALDALLGRCRTRGLVCFVLACSRGAPPTCNTGMARTWQLATATLGSNPAGASQMQRFGAMLLRNRPRNDDGEHHMTIARTSLDGEARLMISPPEAPAASAPAPAPAPPASSTLAPSRPRR